MSVCAADVHADAVRWSVSSACIVSMRPGRSHRPVVPWQDELAIRIVVGGDLFAGGSLAKEVAHTVNRRPAAEAVVRAVPVVEMLPLREPVFELRIPQIDSGPELFESVSLHPFDRLDLDGVHAAGSGGP